MTGRDYPAARVESYVVALKDADTYGQLTDRRDLERLAHAVMAIADAETDPVYRSGYRLGRIHAGKSSHPAADATPPFFEAGHSYRATVHGDLRFRCLAVGFHPVTGERHALGWRYQARLDRWRFAALDAAAWACCDWTDDTDTPTTGKDGAL